MKRKYGFYYYKKSEGFVPLDKSNNPLFKSKKAYQEYIDKTLLPEMGLTNRKEKYWVRHSKKVPELVQINYDGSESVLSTKPKNIYRPVELNSGVQTWNMEHYIYLKCNLSKISLNTILKDFRVKKNSKAFVINYRNFVNKNSKPTNKTILAFPIIEGISLMNLKSNIIPKYKGAVEFCWDIPNIFTTNTEIRTIPDNRLLQLYELYDYVKARKEVNLYNCIKTKQTIFNREYDQKEGNWLTGLYNCKYKPEWVMKEFTSIKDVVNIALKSFPVLMNQFDKWIYPDTGLEELDKVTYLRTRKQIVNIFATNICQFDKEYFTKELKNAVSQVFHYCYNNRQPLCVNQKFISNQNLLKPIEKINIKTFILPKSLDLLKDTYKRQDYQKQFNFMIEQLAYEVIGQMHYDEENQNKTFNSEENQLELSEHIKHTVISDKWFNLFIANLRDNYKWFTIKPNANIKYKLLKALTLTIDEEFIKGVTCKTITSSIKSFFNVIKDNVKEVINILSNYRLDKIIILSFKIEFVKNWLLNEIDQFLEEYEKKLAPPELKIDVVEEEWDKILANYS